MRCPKKLKSTLSISIQMSLLLGVFAGSTDVHAGDAIQVRAESASHELFERDVDAVALQAQDQSIAKLSGLLSKYRKTSQEPVLLEKLAELQQQNAAILFRIAHGNAHRGNKALDLVKYKKEMNQAIESLTVLINKYPSYSEISHAYFIRGKGFEELENKPGASKDYQYLVTKFPLAEETTAAYMSLAEFAIEANEHAKATRSQEHLIILEISRKVQRSEKCCFATRNFCVLTITTKNWWSGKIAFSKPSSMEI
jgi:TolA-binding protein